MSTEQTVLIACKWITTQAPKEWVWIPWEPDHLERVALPQTPPEWETSTEPIPPVQVGQVWNHKKRTNKKQKGSYRSLFFACSRILQILGFIKAIYGTLAFRISSRKQIA